jgi:hypothetical protein
MKIHDKILHFIQKPERQKRFIAVLEILFIVAWAFWVGRKYLKLDPYSALGTGNDDFLISIYPYFPLTRLLHCGDCVLWNGLLNGGSPTFGDTIGALFHPVMVPLILIFGVMNGIKLAMIAALIMGGLALWWIAKVLKLGIIPRIWIVMLGVVAGNLAGPLYSGDVGIVFSVAATGLVIAPGLALALHGRRRDAIIFGLILAQALLSGQGYMQLALIVCLLPAFLIFMVDGNFKLKPLWKEFSLAILIAILVSALFLLPALSFSSKIIKPSEPFSSQPLEYLPINLVIRDMNFFVSTVLGKLSSPNLYLNYIGWIPIVFAIIGWRLIPRKLLRVYIFFIVAIFLIYIVGSSWFIPWLRTWMHNFVSTIRSPVFAIGLAITLILGLGAWCLDLIIKLNWPQLVFSSNPNKTLFRLDTRILLIPILFWSIETVYQFNNPFRFTISWPNDIVKAAESISSNPTGWVRPVYGNWTFTAAAINHNIKITDGYRIWDLKNYPYPTMSLDVSLDSNMQIDSHYSYSVGNVYFSAYPENPYAYIVAGSNKIPCSATADGGHIDMTCQSDQAGTLFIQENALTGWRAWRDNKKVELIPGQLLGVSAPPGNHNYSFRYHPWDVPLGIFISIIGLLLAVWLWFKPQPNPVPGLATLDD